MRQIRIKSRAVAVLAAALLPLLAAAGVITYTATYDSNKLTIGIDTLGGVTYTTVHYDGLYNGGEAGTPSLPIDYLRFSVPYNATNFTVSVSIGMTVINDVSHQVYPCQPSRMMNDPTPVTVTLPDSSAYYSNTLYPSHQAWLVDEGFLAGENHIITVAVMPITFIHNKDGNYTNMVGFSKTVTVTLNYEISDETSSCVMVRDNDVLRNEGYDLTKSMVVNPNDVMLSAPKGINPIPVLNGNEDFGYRNNDSFTYLIVTTPALYKSMKRVAALKRQKGYTLNVVSMDEVMNDSYAIQGDVTSYINGTPQVAYNDNAGVLRQYIRRAYTLNGTKYVLLAGEIPFRDTTLKLNQMQNRFITLSSDLYYSDLTADWSTGQIDYQPELYVGRIIAKSKDQINNYSDKLFRYELNPGNGNGNYLDRIIYSMGFECLNGGELSNARYFFDQIFTESKVLRESQHIYDTSKFPSGKDIIDSINARQYGFISLNHHGFPGGLVTYGLRDGTFADDLRFLWAIDSVHVFADSPSHVNDDPLSGNGLNNMDNKYYPSICYSTACSTIPYSALPGYESLPMNFGESFTTGKDYGGPAFIGNTQTSYTPSTGELEMIFGGRLYSGYYNIGIANGLAKSMNYYISDTVARKYVPVAQNLLGDPELEIWTATPQEFSNISITKTDNSITISGLNSSLTTIAYCDNDGSCGRINASSDTTVYDISPNNSIMLCRHNYIPYIAPLALQNTTIGNSQYVIASDVTAGKSVDNNRTSGQVTVTGDIEYEIEHTGEVRFCGGFKVDKGVKFSVKPSTYNK